MTSNEWNDNEMFMKFIKEYIKRHGIFVFKNSTFQNSAMLLLDEYQMPRINDNSLKIEFVNDNRQCKISYGSKTGPYITNPIQHTELDNTATSKKHSSLFKLSGYNNLQALKNDPAPGVAEQLVDVMTRSYIKTPCIFIKDNINGGKKTHRHKKSKTKKYGKGL